MLQIYTTDKLEYQINGYLNNNTMLFNGKTMPFYYDIVATSGTAYLEEINKEKLKIKEIETNIVDSFSLSITSDKVYLGSQTANVGLYRYVLKIDSVNYYSDLFCVKEQILTEINTMKGGLLKIYDADYFEFDLDGYFNNNTTLKNSGGVVPFYFDTELNISSFSCELMQLNQEKIKVKDFTEIKIKDVTLLQSGAKLYLSKLSQEAGTYRYKINVNSVIFYSEIFYICPPDCGTWYFIDTDCFSYLDGIFADYL